MKEENQVIKLFSKKNSRNILIITRGHPFERDSFFDMIDSLGLNWSHIEHPAAQSFLKKKNLKNFDAILF